MVGQQGPYVFVVGSDNTVSLRPVQTGQRHTDYTVVSSGVKAGEQVVTAGQLGLAQGKKVSPVPYQPPAPLAGRAPSPSPSPAEKK
jgi:multidrug efflux pump subunit AcrA (membrane-fusion protein)